MSKKFNRYPFLITDDLGCILFSSLHGKFEKNECFFNSKHLSQADLQLVSKIGDYRFESKILLLENTQNGKTAFLITSLFPSTRAYIIFLTDIEYGAAVDYGMRSEGQRFAFSDREMLERCDRKACGKLNSLVMITDIAFPASYSRERISSGSMLNEALREISRLAGCETQIASYPITNRYFDSFDSELFSLFMLGILCAASEFSDERTAFIRISGERLRLKLLVEFSKPRERKSDAKELSRIENRFELLFRYIRSLADRKNIPISIITAEDFRCEILPYSPDFAIHGIKEPLKRLKSFDFSYEEEQKKYKES